MKQCGRRFKNWKKRVAACSVFFTFFACACGTKIEQNAETPLEEEWEEAETTPLGKYPELVTYTLAKVGINDHINAEESVTYEDNAYTQYLRRILNVQNKNVFTTSDLKDYKKRIEVMIASGDELPDVMHITDRELLDMLVEEDLLEDLSQAYEECTSDVIKDMYDSYGEDFLKEYMYDGQLIGFPNAEVDHGTNLLWLRKDWMDDLGLIDPETPEEAYEIIKAFAVNNPGGATGGNIGLGFTLSDGDSQIPSFSIRSVFGLSYAYPGSWVPDGNGNIIYGSVGENTKDGLAVLKNLYETGVLDTSFMLRTSENVLELIDTGACGAVFGSWAMPYGYLQTSRENQGADWQPYLLCNEDGYVTSPYRYDNISCIVVRKGYEHPEIVPKILTAIYDYSRNEGISDAVEINEYSTSGRWEIMPLVIDVNYKDNLRQITKQIEDVLEGRTAYEDAVRYIQDMVDKCNAYLDDPDTSVYEWVTYTSRIRAVDELCRVEIRYVNEDYPELRGIVVPDKLKKLEKEAFIKIITGEADLDSFDDFVREWYQIGGEGLTQEVNRIYDKSDRGKESE